MTSFLVQKTTERLEALALGRARERATECATSAAFNAVWRLQNRNRIAEIAMLKKLVVAGHFEG